MEDEAPIGLQHILMRMEAVITLLDNYVDTPESDIRRFIDENTSFGCGYGGIVCGKLGINRKQLMRIINHKTIDRC